MYICILLSYIVQYLQLYLYLAGYNSSCESFQVVARCRAPDLSQPLAPNSLFVPASSPLLFTLFAARTYFYTSFSLFSLNSFSKCICRAGIGSFGKNTTLLFLTFFVLFVNFNWFGTINGNCLVLCAFVQSILLGKIQE